MQVTEDTPESLKIHQSFKPDSKMSNDLSNGNNSEQEPISLLKYLLLS